MEKWVVALVMVMVSLLAVTDGAKAAKAVVLCDITQDGLMACKPSVTTPNPVNPTPPCCEALSAANMTCLCGYKNSFMLPALGVDPTLVMALPAKCNLPPPPNC